MKPKLTISLLALVAIFWFSLPAVQAQDGGCPPDPAPEAVTQYGEILKIIELAPAIPENTTTPQAVAQGIYYTHQVRVDYHPDQWQRVILSSSPEVGWLCSDDLVRLESSAGRVFAHDYRSLDRSRIVSLEPLDVTGLFKDGENVLTISLVDLAPKFMSSSPYYLLVIKPLPGAKLPPAAEITALALPTSPPTFTPAPSPSPTAIPTATPTATPTPRPTATATRSPVITQPASGTAPTLPSLSLPLLPRRIGVGLALLAGAAALAVALARRPRLSGVLEITRQGQAWKAVDLSVYGRRATIGRKGQIKLEDEDEANPSIPAIASRLRAERSPDGRVQVIWQDVAPEGDLEATSYLMTHGDVEVIGPYRLTYENLTEAEISTNYEDGGIWHEIENI